MSKWADMDVQQCLINTHKIGGILVQGHKLSKIQVPINEQVVATKIDQNSIGIHSIGDFCE